jgi:hypothetical protein
MKASYALAVITATLWGLLALLGYDLLEGVRAQHVPGYPSAGQIRYLFYFPISVALAALAICVGSHFQRFRIPAYVLYAVALVLLLPYALSFSGGI